jgi:hypothetical protein
MSKRSFTKFSNLKLYSGTSDLFRDPIISSSHPDNYSSTNIELYKQEILDQQNKIESLENRILLLNSTIQKKAHDLIHKAENSNDAIRIENELFYIIMLEGLYKP